VTPYMLGISATVERKDGLTDLLYMFIGDKIHKEERKKDDIVSVRAIEYETLDYEFNEVITDYRGNTAYSSMISKLCDFTPRAEFIERVLHDLVEESPKSQLLVLSHNRSLLEFLEAKIRICELRVLCRRNEAARFRRDCVGKADSAIDLFYGGGGA
jgi:superfamily II DNA or RNA helicase